MPSLSYLIFTHNEGVQYLDFLFSSIIKHKEVEDEIIVIDDYSDERTTLEMFEKYKDNITLYQNPLNNDFAAHKNFGKDKCTKEYIFQIDADEVISLQLFSTLKEIMINNPQIDLYWLPRVNVVTGLTQADIDRWGWKITDFNGQKLVQWPDYQGRIWKNIPEIKWNGKVHERLSGQTHHTLFPAFDENGTPVTDYAIFHGKSIERQRKQNDFYEKI